MASSVINADIIESVYTATYTPSTSAPQIGEISIPNGYKPLGAVLTSCSASGMSYQLVPSIHSFSATSARVRIDCYYNWGATLTVGVTVYFKKQ